MIDAALAVSDAQLSFDGARHLLAYLNANAPATVCAMLQSAPTAAAAIAAAELNATHRARWEEFMPSRDVPYGSRMMHHLARCIGSQLTTLTLNFNLVVNVLQPSSDSLRQMLGYPAGRTTGPRDAVSIPFTLRHLHISCSKLTRVADLHVFGPGLLRLDLRHCGTITGAGLTGGDQILELPRLETLSVQGCGSLNLEGFKILTGAAGGRLRDLNLSCNRWVCPSVLHYVETHLRGVVALNLTECYSLRIAPLQALRYVVRLPMLSELTALEMPEFLSASALQILAVGARAESLAGVLPIKGDTADPSGRLSPTPAFHRLTLGGLVPSTATFMPTDLADSNAGLVALCHGNTVMAASLQRLQMRYLASASIADLQLLGALHNVRVLSLARSFRVTDAVVANCLAAMGRLEELDVSECKDFMGDPGVLLPRLRATPAMALRRLDVTDTKFAAPGLRVLQDVTPNIVWLGVNFDATRGADFSPDDLVTAFVAAEDRPAATLRVARSLPKKSSWAFGFGAAPPGRNAPPPPPSAPVPPPPRRRLVPGLRGARAAGGVIAEGARMLGAWAARNSGLTQAPALQVQFLHRSPRRPPGDQQDPDAAVVAAAADQLPKGFAPAPPPPRTHSSRSRSDSTTSTDTTSTNTSTDGSDDDGAGQFPALPGNIPAGRTAEETPTAEAAPAAAAASAAGTTETPLTPALPRLRVVVAGAWASNLNEAVYHLQRALPITFER
jgi:hypothetical protein